MAKAPADLRGAAFRATVIAPYGVSRVANPWPDLPTRPWLPPVLRRVWRSAGVLQIGTDPDTAIVIEGVEPALYELIKSLNGKWRTQDLIDRAAARGVSSDRATDLIRHLFSAGCIVDLDPDPQATRTRTWPVDDQLLPDLAARALAPPGGAPAVIAARRASSSVVIHGSRRLGSVLGSLLAASGVGRVCVVDRGKVEAADVVPGGASHGDIGGLRETATRAAIRRSSTRTSTGAPDSLTVPDLVIITDPWPETGERERVLRMLGSPYLFVAIRERRAIVGPFVIPYQTSCLQCQQLHRRDRDPQWDSVAAQLRVQPTTAADVGESPLVTLAASLSAMQALNWLDGECRPLSCDATLEFRGPEVRIERRAWRVHPRCECSRRA